ncbi:MAG: hypothetical protein U0570_05915 [Phycisphaerales bacterium]
MLMRLVAALFACCLALAAVAQSNTAFTYQGQIATGGANVNGAADFQFRLYDAASGGTQVGSQFVASNVAVSAGRFTTSLDFGSAFTGAKPLWLEIDVRSPAGSGNFTTLSPRGAVTPVPLAQSLAGIPIIAGGGAAKLDLAQDGQSNSGIVIQNFQPCWQSFTADKSGNLIRIDLNCFSLWGTPGPNTLKVYSGVGIGGTLLATTTATVTGLGILSFPVSGVELAAGSKYTFAFSGPNSFAVAPSAIAGAVGSHSTGAVNWWFRTYVAGALLLAAADDSGTLNGKPSSDYLPPTVQNWTVTNLPANSLNPSSVTTVIGSVQNLNLSAGTAVINWATSARVSAPGVYQIRVRLGSAAGPWTAFAFNQSQVHMSISGNAAIAVPSTGSYPISLEITGPLSGSLYIVDQNDSITATVLNIRQ